MSRQSISPTHSNIELVEQWEEVFGPWLNLRCFEGQADGRMGRLQMKDIKSKLVCAVFAIVIGGFFLLNRMIAPPEISQSERRPLAKLPALSFKSIVSTDFMDGFEAWAADRFVWREGLRRVRAEAVFHLFLQTDKDGLYYGASGAGKFEKVNRDDWLASARKITSIAEGMQALDLNLYFAYIPDKSLYAGKPLPGFDPDEAELIYEALPDSMQCINLDPALSAQDFYRTDLHWDQTRLDGVVNILGEAMGSGQGADGSARDGENSVPAVDDEGIDEDADAVVGNGPQGVPGRAISADGSGDPFSRMRVNTAGEFSGVYAGQLALPLAPDTLRYLTSPILDSANVYYLNAQSGKMEHGPLYDLERFSGNDPYDLFLRGAQPLVMIENPEAETDRTLYLFRDSFGSSLAPLLIDGYRRVMLIDLRYIDSRVLPEYVSFEPGSDVLFLYSSQILNKPSVLLVP